MKWSVFKFSFYILSMISISINVFSMDRLDSSLDSPQKEYQANPDVWLTHGDYQSDVSNKRNRAISFMKQFVADRYTQAQINTALSSTTEYFNKKAISFLLKCQRVNKQTPKPFHRIPWNAWGWGEEMERRSWERPKTIGVGYEKFDSAMQELGRHYRLGGLINLDGIQKIPKISTVVDLCLIHNDLSSLQEGVFSVLTNLNELNLSHNRLENLAKGTFRGLTKLNKLDLMRNQLKDLQDGVFSDLTNLTWLSFYSNQLSNLSRNSLCELINLIYLDLYNNRLSYLPEGVLSRLRNLMYLYLAKNELTNLPHKDFDELTKLEWLDLRDNKLTNAEKIALKEKLPLKVVIKF